MLRFIKKYLQYWIVKHLHNSNFWGSNLAFNSRGSIKGISLNKQPCQSRPTIVNINSNKTTFYPFTVNFDKCGGSCNTADDQNMNVEVFNF